VGSDVAVDACGERAAVEREFESLSSTGEFADDLLTALATRARAAGACDLEIKILHSLMLNTANPYGEFCWCLALADAHRRHGAHGEAFRGTLMFALTFGVSIGCFEELVDIAAELREWSTETETSRRRVARKVFVGLVLGVNGRFVDAVQVFSEALSLPESALFPHAGLRGLIEASEAGDSETLRRYQRDGEV